ncbi:hypothetical protein [Rubrivirga sp.]|uniref:hypothetical protein n=1 Tax=Rubrivirga sp. TaxID=1885344 RepID=UPI003B51739D
MTSFTSLPPTVVHVLDRLPDPPATFTASDVLDALAEVRALGVAGADGLDVGAVLDALTAAEVVVGRSGVYVVRAEARPF